MVSSAYVPSSRLQEFHDVPRSTAANEPHRLRHDRDHCRIASIADASGKIISSLSVVSRLRRSDPSESAEPFQTLPFRRMGAAPPEKSKPSEGTWAMPTLRGLWRVLRRLPQEITTSRWPTRRLGQPDEMSGRVVLPDRQMSCVQPQPPVSGRDSLQCQVLNQRAGGRPRRILVVRQGAEHLIDQALRGASRGPDAWGHPRRLHGPDRDGRRASAHRAGP